MCVTFIIPITAGFVRLKLPKVRTSAWSVGWRILPKSTNTALSKLHTVAYIEIYPSPTTGWSDGKSRKHWPQKTEKSLSKKVSGLRKKWFRKFGNSISPWSSLHHISQMMSNICLRMQRINSSSLNRILESMSGMNSTKDQLQAAIIPISQPIHPNLSIIWMFLRSRLSVSARRWFHSWNTTTPTVRWWVPTCKPKPFRW